VDEGKSQPKAVGYRRGTLGATRIRTDDDRVAVVGDVVLDVAFQQRPGVEVVD
jgi:hypothetical protein